MEALGELNPVSRVEAEIQKYVGDFLGLKSVLISLKGSPSLQISSKAAGLLAVQQQMEGELQNNLAKISVMKQSGTYDISSTLAIGEFAARMYNHVNTVKQLQNEARIGMQIPQPGLVGGFGGGQLLLLSLGVGLVIYAWTK